jgi:hypothetical protein
MTYKAVVGKIFTSPHPNADRLKIGHIHGFRVIVGADTQDEELYVFFDCDGQLSEQFAQQHDLVRRKNEDGTHAGGFFEEKRRVRAQPFRGVRSEGFAMPISSLAFTGYDIANIKDGDQFDELNGIPICNKYYTQATKNAMGKAQKKNALKAAFPEHYETTQFRFATLEAGDLVVITEKEHGTSVRYGFVQVERELNWFQRLMRRPKTYMDWVLGTRRAILQKKNGSEYEFVGGFYGSGEPYTKAANRLYGRLKANEIVYAELVGYCSNGSPLFTHSLSKLPELEKQYGSPITYSYGCLVGECRLRVYRITHDGRDLSYFEIQRRAEELGVELVTHLDMFVYDGNKDALDARVQSYLEGPSLIDDTHIREGVCIRVENKWGHKVFKEKSWSFKVAEGIAKDNDTYVDAEEVA